MIPRYTRPEIGAVWTQQAKLESWLEVELAATEAWAAEGVVPADAAREARERAAFTVEAVDEREKVTDHDVAAFVDVVAGLGRRARALDPLRPHLLRRARHGAGAAAAARPERSSLPGACAYRDALVDAGARASRHPLRRPHPRRPRRADHLRPAARRLRLRGRPQPRPARGRLRPARRRQALRRRRHLRLGAAGGRGAGDGEARPRPRGRRHPGRSRATATRSCWARSRSPAPASSGSRPRSATCREPRCARSKSRSPPARRAPRRCRTSATRSAPSGSPASPACCAATRRRRSRTSPSGTSATSPTPVPSG